MRFAKKFLCFLIVVVSLLSYSALSVGAASEYYYKGFTINYNGAPYYDHKVWYGGLFDTVRYDEYFYITNSYFRCLTYYNNAWIANQGQMLTITSSKSVSRTVSNGVSYELGVEDAVGISFGETHTDSVTTQYSTSLSLSYDLSKFSHKSYRIASMGYYDRFIVDQYKKGKFNKNVIRYAYDHSFGQEIRLVYRY